MAIGRKHTRRRRGSGRRLGITVCGESAVALAAWWRRLARAQRSIVIRAIRKNMARLAADGAIGAGDRAISIRRKRISARAAAMKEK